MNNVDLVVEWSRQRGPDPVEWGRAAWNRVESIWVSLIEFSPKYRMRLEAEVLSKRLTASKKCLRRKLSAFLIIRPLMSIH